MSDKPTVLEVLDQMRETMAKPVPVGVPLTVPEVLEFCDRIELAWRRERLRCWSSRGPGCTGTM